MMKLGYFSHTNLTVSETFIYDLIKDLNKAEDIDLTYYSGRNSGKIGVDFKLRTVMSGYFEAGEQLSYKAFKLGQIFGKGKGYRYKMAVQKRRSFKALERTVREPMDVAFIDYANSGILLREYLNARNIPFIVHVHGYDITSSLNDPEYRVELKKLMQDATFLVTASEYMKRLLVLQGADENKIRVVRYGIDVRSIEPLAWTERLKKAPSVIFLGRLTEKKHPIALIHAFHLVLKSLPSAKLTIIGDGPLKQEMLARIGQLGIADSVNYLGSLPREQSFPIMNQHWVFAQHSVTARSGDQEGYALSPAEAAAHELPVVATLHNGIPEHVLEGKTGYLVPEFNYEEMAAKILYLLKNPEQAEMMGKAGRQNILKMNDQQLRVRSIKILFEQIKRTVA